jgi:IS30 family transposase
MVSIHERPSEVADKTIPRHWESDLIIGKDHKSALGTLVERTTRTVCIVPFKKSYDAETVRKAFTKIVKRLPKEVVKTVTHD